MTTKAAATLHRDGQQRTSSGHLRRACACGQHTHGGSCESCRRNGGRSLGTSTASSPASHATQLDDAVNRGLQSPGRALEPGTRDFFERRLRREAIRTRVPLPRAGHQPLGLTQSSDHHETEAEAVARGVSRRAPAPSPRLDLGHVHIHTGEQAAASARALGARAYTVGADVVLGSGEYSPGTAAGQEVLANELVHVVQQQDQPRAVQRLPDFLKAIARFFGSEDYDAKELNDYLERLDKGTIEAAFDSDNKARAVIKAWRVGGSRFVLTAQRKALLIQEMQKGYTGGADEEAILELLERSYNFELSHIFGAGGVTARSLNSDFSGDNAMRLSSFYDRRFSGGEESLLKGTVQPVGYPIPLGTVLPQLGETGTPIDTLKGADPNWNQACVAGILCTQDRSVVEALRNLTVLRSPTVTEYYWIYEGTAWSLKTKEHLAFSNSDKKLVGIKPDAGCGTAAAAMVHEVRHQNQPPGDVVSSEKDAYTFEEEYTLKRGLPGRSAFRTTGPKGEEVVDPAAIEKYVIARYSGASAVKGERIVGHEPDSSTRVIAPDGTPGKRPPQQKDSHQDYDKTDAALSNAPRVDPKQWVCKETP
jgi:uncharacterized protein DUF4157